MTSDAAFVPLDPRGTVLGDEVYTVLGEAILDGRLSPGERLRDIELAQRLGVSRTPVREALQRLERSGLVEVAAGRWTRVSAPDPSVLAATHEFVVYTMGNAVRMAMARCTDDEHAMLLADIDAIVEASAADNVAAMFRDSIRFFIDVTKAAGNVALTTMIDEAEFALRRNLHGWTPYVKDPVVRTRMNLAVRDAVTSRDGDAAERLLRRQHGFA